MKHGKFRAHTTHTHTHARTRYTVVCNYQYSGSITKSPAVDVMLISKREMLLIVIAIVIVMKFIQRQYLV